MEQHYHFHRGMSSYPVYQDAIYRPKKKWFAGMLAFFVPGAGHMYLGLLQRGLMFMCLMACNISLLPLLLSQNDVGVGLITVVALGVPIIYVYTIFDTLQSADLVNYMISQSGRVSESLTELAGNYHPGFMLLGMGGWFFILSVKPVWLTTAFQLFGSYLGGLIFMAVGVGMILFNRGRKRS